MTRCGCNPVPEPFEFPIQNSSITQNTGFVLKDVYENKGTICELKRKIICDFYDILRKLECGILPDLEFLLEEISVVYGT